MTRLKNYRGFTLVELLAVIVIIGLMITISIPSLHRITEASALGNGTRQFSDQVAMARTYAVTNGKDVYLVVANSQTAAQNTTLSNTYCYTSYGFFVSAVAWASGVNPFSQISYIDAIQYLPQGAVFANQISNVSTSVVPFPTSTNTAINVWCVKINKFGQITPLTGSPQFSITQGYVDPGSSILASTPVKTYSGVNTVTINPLTGKAVVTKS